MPRIGSTTAIHHHPPSSTSISLPLRAWMVARDGKGRAVDAWMRIVWQHPSKTRRRGMAGLSAAVCSVGVASFTTQGYPGSHYPSLLVPKV